MPDHEPGTDFDPDSNYYPRSGLDPRNLIVPSFKFYDHRCQLRFGQPDGRRYEIVTYIRYIKGGSERRINWSETRAKNPGIGDNDLADYAKAIFLSVNVSQLEEERLEEKVTATK